jgi:hypothetical protein
MRARMRGGIASTRSLPRHYMGRVVKITPWPRFIARERNPGTHGIGGWVGFRPLLDTEAREKFLCLCRELNTGRPICSQTL